MVAPLAHAAPPCAVPASGPITRAQLPEGSDAVQCRAVGRVLRSNGAAVTVPVAGEAVGSSSLRADGEHVSFQLEVSAEGLVSYPPTDVPSIDTRRSERRDPGGCSDNTWSENDLKEYGTYQWWMGDGTMPAGLARATVQGIFSNAIGGITGSYNDCGMTTTIFTGSASYGGYTANESDMDSVGTCLERDHVSTWDANNLELGTVAKACWWSAANPGVKNDLIEADVRLNGTDYNFTNTPSTNCTNAYDIRSVSTHEAGHVFGLGHTGAGHNQLTMFNNSLICSNIARTLGLGDVHGLWSIY
jgi:hypothetical protein